MSTFRIKANINELTEGVAVVVLDSDAVAGSGTITVKSITGVAVNQLLLFRTIGSEKAEIVAVHASTAPSGNTVTLASNLVEDHPANTKVFLINSNKIHFYHSATEDDANVDDTNLSALATAQNIDPTEATNYYLDSAQTSGYYYFRFENSITSTTSPYSDPIPWTLLETGLANGTVGKIFNDVQESLHRKFDERFSKGMALDSVTRCLEYIQGKMRAWNRYLESDHKLGQTARGRYSYDLPTDIYDKYTKRSILNVTIVGSELPLTWLDEKEFDVIVWKAKHTQVRTQATAGQTTLEVDNSYDFNDDGSIHIFSGNTDDEITYTAITRSATAGVFTGVPATGTGAIATTHAVDADVWQNHEEGKPEYFTIRNGQILIYPLPNATWINKNLLLDYNKQATSVDSEGDEIDTERREMVYYWLMADAYSHWTTGGKRDLKDPDFIMFQDILKTTMKTTPVGQRKKMNPKLNTIRY